MQGVRRHGAFLETAFISAKTPQKKTSTQSETAIFSPAANTSAERAVSVALLARRNHAFTKAISWLVMGTSTKRGAVSRLRTRHLTFLIPQSHTAWSRPGRIGTPKKEGPDCAYLDGWFSPSRFRRSRRRRCRGVGVLGLKATRYQSG